MFIINADVVIDPHTIAAISVAGTACDGIGGLYLAYDLLGGNNGPLRTITRVVTYGLIFCLGYGILLDLLFGPLKALELALVAGLGLGVILGLEYTLVTKRKLQGRGAARWSPFLFGMLRGTVFGLAGGLLIGPAFGLCFGLLSACGLMAVYAFRLSPTNAYQPDGRPRVRARELLASALRGGATALAGVLAALLTYPEAWKFGLEFGIVAGLVSALVSVFSPLVEWWANRLPARRLGVFGTVVFLIGLILQSIQYWVVLLNVPVR